jgi:hypothetical protein
LYFVFIRSDAWQLLQTSAEIFNGEEDFNPTILCSEWQSVQVGASRCPAATALPCTLSSTSRAASSWQAPHVSASFEKCKGDSGDVGGTTVWPSWQSLHVAESKRPLAIASPCTLAP